MMDRLVSEENDLDTVFGRSIDFEAVDKIRERERAASLAYLRNALNGKEII